MTRFLEPAGIVQAWGNLSDPRQRGRTIIDSLMNMPLLYWASSESGDERFANAAKRHTAQLRDNIFRADDSTYHTFHWDVQTGVPLNGTTAQGFADDSCWARGQAWGILGFALNHRFTGDPSFLHAAIRCADYFLAHLPQDTTPFWDMVFGTGSSEERDSSAGAIAVCGLLECAHWLPNGERRQRYLQSADDLLLALVEGCTPTSDSPSDALLLHGVYSKPEGKGVDEGNLWGDYFYLEALMRRTNPRWQLYW
jgi:unsaturated chondroitin disaccharide hydrolase